MNYLFRKSVLFISALVLASSAFAADQAEALVVGDKLQVPGAVLDAGTYALSIEDTLADRAIVRLSSKGGGDSYLLAVPNANIATSSESGIVYFDTHSHKALRAWKCTSCASTLEFVYPKLEAVKLTDETTDPVVAVDPAYDKLPPNLSPDDMKVVSLWLLSPERITKDHVGEGVKAAKYTNLQPRGVTSASNQTPVAPSSAQPTQMATAQVRRHLPKTAGDTYALLLAGLGLLSAGAYIRLRRFRQQS